MFDSCQCCLNVLPLVEFGPALVVERTARRRERFQSILSQISTLEATRQTHPDLFSELDKVRVKKCFRCRDSLRSSQHNPNTKTGACRAFWYELRQAACVDCGRDDGFSEYDHQDDRGPKLHNLGDYQWWVWNGGVDAMRAEAAKCVARCRNCHSMQPSGNKYKRKYATLEEMPTDTKYQKIAKLTRKAIDDKIAFVDARKMEIGVCAECDYQVLPERCHVFVFAHIDAATKTKSVAQLCNQHNTLKTARTGLEEEMAKCRLLCSVCHSKETRDRNTRSPERRGQASSSSDI